MRSLVAHLRSLRPQIARLVVEAESSTSLSVRNGRTLTLFDRLTRAVTQNGRQVTTFGSIHHVRIEEKTREDGTSACLVALQLAGSRDVAIGRTTDGSEASLAAAQIAKITGTLVVAKRVD